MTFYTPLIILCIFSINYLLYKKDFYSKKLYIISTFFLSTYILLSIVIFYNNLSNNFTTGVLYGDILNSHFCDEYKYLADSEILKNHFKNGNFNLWITKQLPPFEFIDSHSHPGFGNYNFFVLILSLLRLIGINSALDFILIKLFIYIPTIIYLYKVCKIYLSENFSLFAISIFSILPGFVLTNCLLMRDNIILFLIIAILYYILSKNYRLIALIPLSLILLSFRSYLIPVIIATVIFTYKNDKKLISYKDIIFFVIIILTIYFFINYNFTVDHSNILFSYYQIAALQDNFALSYGTGFSMLINLFTQTALHIMVDPLFINFLLSNLVYLILISLGNIMGMVVSFIFSIKFLMLSIKNTNPKILYLLKFTFYFTALNSLIIMAKDSYIINRLALMWFPLFILIILIPINNKNKSLINFSSFWK